MASRNATRLARVLAVDAQVEGEVVARARRDDDEREAVLDRDGRDERLGAVAAGHAQAVGAAGDGVAGQLLEVEPVVEHHGLDAQLLGQRRPARTSRPCRRPTTGCRSAPGESAAPRPRTWTSSWCSSRTIAARPHASTSASSPSTSATRSPTRSAPPMARTKATTISTKPTTTLATPTARARHGLGDDPPPPGDGDAQADERQREIPAVAKQDADDHRDQPDDTDQRDDGEHPAPARDLIAVSLMAASPPA